MLLEAVVIDWPNEAAESTSPRIQWVKRMACGSRNRECVCDAIIVHLATLDLHPRSVSAITIS
jgi:transposase